MDRLPELDAQLSLYRKTGRPPEGFFERLEALEKEAEPLEEELVLLREKEAAQKGSFTLRPLVLVGSGRMKGFPVALRLDGPRLFLETSDGRRWIFSLSETEGILSLSEERGSVQDDGRLLFPEDGKRFWAVKGKTGEAFLDAEGDLHFSLGRFWSERTLKGPFDGLYPIDRGFLLMKEEQFFYLLPGGTHGI